jgi:hypothetical protein
MKNRRQLLEKLTVSFFQDKQRRQKCSSKSGAYRSTSCRVLSVPDKNLDGRPRRTGLYE